MTYEHLGLRLPEIGRVKLGQKGEEKIGKKSGKKYREPEKLDYFKIVKLERGSDNNFEIDTRAHEIYGDKPKCLQVRPISGRLEENIQAGFNLYSTAGVRLCFGDGQTGNQIDAQTGEVITRQCPCAEYEALRCKKYAKTSFFLDKVGGLGGVHTMTIRGRITVPALVGSLKYLSSVCEDAEKSIAGVGLELRLNEVMTKYGKVYSPYFIFTGTREELLDLAVNAASSKFRVLADEDEEADDTEDTEGAENAENQASYPTGKESIGAGEKDETPAAYNSGVPAKTEAPKSEKPKAPEAKDVPAKPETQAGQGESVKAEDGKAEDVKGGENKGGEGAVAAGNTVTKPPLKGFWCDSCKKIVVDHRKPSQCKCGETKFHEAESFAAAQAAVIKAINKGQAQAQTPAKLLTFWCDGCYGIIEQASKPGDCVCGKNHWHGAANVEAAKKAVEAITGSATAPAAPQTEEARIRDAKIGAIGAGVKKIFGSSNQGAILKQISLLLERPIEASQYLADCELDELTEFLDAVKDMPKNDRDGFIEVWKQGRKERGDA